VANFATSLPDQNKNAKFAFLSATSVINWQKLPLDRIKTQSFRFDRWAKFSHRQGKAKSLRLSRPSGGWRNPIKSQSLALGTAANENFAFAGIQAAGATRSEGQPPLASSVAGQAGGRRSAGE
jgi:hypothetical protein